MSVAEPRLNYEVAELFSRAGERRRIGLIFSARPSFLGRPAGKVAVPREFFRPQKFSDRAAARWGRPFFENLRADNFRRSSRPFCRRPLFFRALPRG